jgi:hypothetical protein
MKEKKRSIPHTVLSYAAWLIFAGCLIRFLAVYHSLEAEIGIHFCGDGKFDITDKKIYGFYPFVFSLVTLGLCALFCFLAGKAKIGKRMNEKGERLLRTAVILYCDIFQLRIVFFFSGVWSDCVIRQRALNTRIGVIILFVLMGLFLVMVIFMIAVRVKCRVKEK